jgi:acyl carrier protein
MNETESKLREIILKTARMDLIEETENLFLDPECDLMVDFGLDSLLMVELVVDIESAFDIEFGLEDLDIEVLKKYNELLKYINDHKG